MQETQNETGLELFYGDLAQSYGYEKLSHSEYLKQALLYQVVRSTDVCLDIGAANGIHLIPLASKVQKIVGMDMSERMLSECAKRVAAANLKNVELIRSDGQRLNFSDGFFDVVYSYSTLLFVENLERLLQEISRVLRRGGTAILDINGRFNLSKWYWERFYRGKGVPKLNSYSLSRIQSILNSLNLEIKERHAVGVLDQWKYIPFTNPLKVLVEKWSQPSPNEPTLDYRLSQLFSTFANRWYFVVRKT